MFLLVGLGNCGGEYSRTRHNFGFLLLDRLISEYGLEAKGNKHKSEFFVGEVNYNKIIAIKPQTYMNLSGQAVASVVSFFKIPKEKILVLHDDLDLELGRIKTKFGGGNGGHNGLKSIDQALGNGYFRLRLGIGRPNCNIVSVSDYVLSAFARDEMELLNEVIAKIVKNFPILLAQDFEKFLNSFYKKPL